MPRRGDIDGLVAALEQGIEDEDGAAARAAALTLAKGALVDLNRIADALEEVARLLTIIAKASP